MCEHHFRHGNENTWTTSRKLWQQLFSWGYCRSRWKLMRGWGFWQRQNISLSEFFGLWGLWDPHRHVHLYNLMICVTCKLYILQNMSLYVRHNVKKRNAGVCLSCTFYVTPTIFSGTPWCKSRVVSFHRRRGKRPTEFLPIAKNRSGCCQLWSEHTHVNVPLNRQGLPLQGSVHEQAGSLHIKRMAVNRQSPSTSRLCPWTGRAPPHQAYRHEQAGSLHSKIMSLINLALEDKNDNGVERSDQIKLNLLNLLCLKGPEGITN